MKYLIFSDLHIEDRQSITYFNNNSRLKDCFNTLNQILGVCSDRQYDIIFLGDTFEKKDNIPAKLLVPFVSKIFNLQFNYDPAIYFLLGNHDYKSRDYVIIDLLQETECANVIKNYCWVNDNLIFIPNGKSLRDCNISNFEDKTILFHDEIIGAKYANRVVVNQKVDVFDKYKFKLAIGGHIHTPQEFDIENGHIIYLGSIHPVDFSETHQGRYMIYDSETGEYEFHYINHPKFITIDNFYTLKDESLIKDNYIRIKMTIPEEYYLSLNINQIDDAMKASGARGYINEISSYSPVPDEIIIHQLDTNLLSDDDLLLEVVNQSTTDLNKKEIFDYGKEIMDE